MKINMLRVLKRNAANFADLGKILGPEKISLTEAIRWFFDICSEGKIWILYIIPFCLIFRTQYGHDESPHAVNKLPECVTFPKSTADITKIVKWCNENNISMVPYGTGSGLEGLGQIF